MFFMKATVFLVIVTASGCVKTNDSATKTINIFGPDDRQTLPLATPWRAVGRIGNCSAVTVGDGLALTAAHCLLSRSNRRLREGLGWYRPYTSLSLKERFWIQYVWLGSLRPQDQRHRDWALISFDLKGRDEPLTSLPVSRKDISLDLPQTVTGVGFHSDRRTGRRPLQHRDCQLKRARLGVIFNNCDSTAGVSGGPILSMTDPQPEVVALAVSEYRNGAAFSRRLDEYSESSANVAIPTVDAGKALSILMNSDKDRRFVRIPGTVFVANPNKRPTMPCQAEERALPLTELIPRMSSIQPEATRLSQIGQKLLTAAKAIKDPVGERHAADLLRESKHMITISRMIPFGHLHITDPCLLREDIDILHLISQSVFASTIKKRKQYEQHFDLFKTMQNLNETVGKLHELILEK